MVVKVFSLWDKKARFYQPPHFSTSILTYARSLRYDINSNPSSMVSLNTQDFDVFELGEFDNNSGLIEAYAPPRQVGTLDGFLREDAPPDKE